MTSRKLPTNTSRTLATAVTLATVAILGAGPAQAKDAFCPRLSNIDKAVNALDADRKPFAKVLKEMKDASNSAPSAIKDAWKTLAGGFEKLNDFRAKMKSKANDPKALANLQKDAIKLGTDPKFNNASEKIKAWAQKECGPGLNH